jgi:hypothetical protein
LVELVELAAQERECQVTLSHGDDPHLEPVRAETFWGYYRAMNPLFDDRFMGEGMFVGQETSTPGAGARAGRFWSGVWNGLLKIVGLQVARSPGNSVQFPEGRFKNRKSVNLKSRDFQTHPLPFPPVGRRRAVQVARLPSNSGMLGAVAKR